MKRAVLVVLFAAVVHASPARGQSLTAEADVTAGYSTDEVAAVATQLRAFGDLKAGVRFYLEGAWARRSDKETDAFAAAYPYGGHLEVIETYGERLFTPGKSLVGVRAGRYRTPIRDRGPQRPRVFRIPSIAADSLRRQFRAVEHVSRARRRRDRGRPAVVCGDEPGRARGCRRREATVRVRQRRSRAGLPRPVDRRRQPHPNASHSTRIVRARASRVHRRRRPVDARRRAGSRRVDYRPAVRWDPPPTAGTRT